MIDLEAVLFVGIQASGKSSFYRERFFDTHVRISLDVLRTRQRLKLLLTACIEAKQPFVVDNTNVTAEERARFIAPARAAGFSVTGYYFRSSVEASLARNAARSGRQRIPDAGVRGTHARLELPSRAEGFDRLRYVHLIGGGGFAVEDWREDA